MQGLKAERSPLDRPSPTSGRLPPLLPRTLTQLHVRHPPEVSCRTACSQGTNCFDLVLRSISTSSVQRGHNQLDKQMPIQRSIVWHDAHFRIVHSTCWLRMRESEPRNRTFSLCGHFGELRRSFIAELWIVDGEKKSLDVGRIKLGHQ